MTREEALRRVSWIKWHFEDLGSLVMSGIAEDCEFRLRSDSPLMLRKFSDLAVLQPGRKGRVRLILLDPYKARATATLRGIMYSVEA